MIKRDFRVKMDIKLTREDKSLRFDQSDKCFELSWAYRLVKVVSQIAMS